MSPQTLSRRPLVALMPSFEQRRDASAHLVSSPTTPIGGSPRARGRVRRAFRDVTLQARLL